jgi:hypothetical protein
MDKLFDIPLKVSKPRAERCKNCEHITCIEYNYPVKRFFYCKLRKSNRTDNGLLKIKANQVACDGYVHSK